MAFPVCLFTATSRFHLPMCFKRLVIAVLAFGIAAQQVSIANDAFVVPEGFVVETAAGDELCHDALCMTLDGLGRPVISGPGYVRTLIDDNGDGVYERGVLWSSLPKQGAQGLWAEGDSVLWVGDQGLWKSRDVNRDLVADGSPMKVFSLPTGGEHHAHAIRRGPDGYWYLIAGNFSNGISSLTRTNDPVIARPRAGTIWRLSPDFSRSSAWAHGFRNAYDFDFMANGRIVTYDSDEEREVSLPWYRPTRVLAVSPGNDGGWLSSTWFDHDDRITMPQVVSRLGRASPTGVVVYHHESFPEKYREAVFVLDWTFGRVIAIYPQPTTDANRPSRFMAETFMQSSGTVGFAPTDACVTPDGSLLVCVGGRGTTGGLYRIRCSSSTAGDRSSKMIDRVANIADPKARIEAILDMPSPWESWSMSVWKPAMAALPKDALQRYIVAERASATECSLQQSKRLRRAVQIAVHLELPIDASAIKSLITAPCSVVKSAGYWLISRKIPRDNSVFNDTMFASMLDSLESPSKEANVSDWDLLLGGLVPRSFFEMLGLQRWNPNAFASIEFDLNQFENWRERLVVHQAQLWAYSRLGTVAAPPVSATSPIDNTGSDAMLARALFASSSSSLNAGLLDDLARCVSAKKIGSTPDAILESLTTLQVCLGDSRLQIIGQQAPPSVHALDGYRAVHSKDLPTAVREGWSKWCIAQVGFEGDDKFIVRNEALRTLAMFQSNSSEAIDCALKTIDEESHPTGDLHALCVVACCQAIRTSEQTEATARALLNISKKVRSLALNIDSRWDLRLEEIFKELLKRDVALSRQFVDDSSSIDSDRLFWLAWIPPEDQVDLRKRMIEQLLSQPTESWDSDFVRFCSSSTVDSRIIDRLRNDEWPTNVSQRIELLSRTPDPQDYELFLDQLAMDNREVWPSAWKALSRLSITSPQRELDTLSLFWSRWHLSPPAEFSETPFVNRLRSVCRMLRLPNVPPRDGWREWEPFLAKYIDAKVLATIRSELAEPKPWLDRIEQASTLQGDAKVGQALFQSAKCGQCHGSGNALGPDLSGITRRFARDDLFRAIFEPSRDIPDRYRALRLLTVDGEVVVGMKVYESIDGVTLQTADGKVVRVNQADIESRVISPVSLMPSGLIDSFNSQQIADLYSYLSQL